MKYTLWWTLSVAGKHHAIFLKDIETKAALSVGMEIEGEAWKEPEKIVGLTFNMDTDTTTVFLEGISVTSVDFALGHERAFIGRGWRKLG